MDGLTVLGLLTAFFAILIGQWIEGGDYHSLINTSALLIVLGGTFGAVMVQTPFRVFKHAFKILSWVIKPNVLPFDKTQVHIVEMSRKSRQFGLMALEEISDKEPDPLIRTGLELLVVGVDKVTIRHVLEHEIVRMESFDLQAAKVFESMGGYSPTVGILGAVLGLIHVMQNLSDPNSLGSGIAVAFVATIYGVGFANLIFLPVAQKLKSCIAAKVLYNEMIVEGLVAMAGGESPHMITLKLNNFDKQLSYVTKKTK